MKLGKMRYRIKFLKYTATTDTDGFVSREWNEYCTVWADVTPISAKEYFSLDTETAEVTYKIYVRYRPDIDTTMRVVWNNKTYLIVSVLGDVRNNIMTIMAKEVSLNGEDEHNDAGSNASEAE